MTATLSSTASSSRVGRDDLTSADGEEREAAQGGLGLNLKPFRKLRSSLAALRAR